MIDIRSGSDRGGKWLCGSCHTWNEDSKPRCGWCSADKPAASVAEADTAASDAKLTQNLHNIVEKLSPQNKKRLFAWLEDNIL